jgi:hypothetical protein
VLDSWRSLGCREQDRPESVRESIGNKEALGTGDGIKIWKPQRQDPEKWLRSLLLWFEYEISTTDSCVKCLVFSW